MNVIRTAAFGFALALAVSPAALAAHGKVGTWEVTTTFGGAQHQMMMHGPGGMTARFCMTAAQVNSAMPPMTHHGNCQTQNMKAKGNSFSADIVCKGNITG